MKKIVFFVTSLHSGGAERVAANLSNAWADRGYSVLLVTIASRQYDFYELNESVQRLAMNATGETNGFFESIFDNVKRVSTIRGIVKSASPDTVVSFMTSNNVMVLLGTLGLSCRVVISERTHPPFTTSSRLWKFLRKYTYGFASEVVVMASEGREWVEVNTRARRVSVIQNWVNWPIAVTEPRELPEERIAPGRKILLTVGAPAYVKGHDLICDAFSELKDDFPDWDLAFVGTEDLATMSNVERCSLQSRAIVVGQVGNVGDWYSAASVYILASRFEGFPNALLEAMATGVPVIALDCDTGPRDLIETGVNGLLVGAENVSELKYSMRALMSDQARRDELGASASGVLQTYSKEKIVEAWCEVL